MPHSSFKESSHPLNSRIGKCPCGQTFGFLSERDMNMKLRMHCKVCPNKPEASKPVRLPKKAMTLREKQLNEAEGSGTSMIIISIIYPTWIDITTSERNQEAPLYLQVSTSALLIQMPSQVHLLGSTSHDYQSLPQLLSICKSS